MIRRPPRSPLFPLHYALPIYPPKVLSRPLGLTQPLPNSQRSLASLQRLLVGAAQVGLLGVPLKQLGLDRKSTRLNSSHANISYAVFCLKKKTTETFNQSALNK